MEKWIVLLIIVAMVISLLWSSSTQEKFEEGVVLEFGRLYRRRSGCEKGSPNWEPGHWRVKVRLLDGSTGDVIKSGYRRVNYLDESDNVKILPLTYTLSQAKYHVQKYEGKNDKNRKKKYTKKFLEMGENDVVNEVSGCPRE